MFKNNNERLNQLARTQGSFGKGVGKNPFTFIHVPKTGGRSIRVGLGLAGLGCFASFPESYINSPEWSPAHEEMYNSERSKRAFILDGHVPAIFYRDHYPEKFNESFTFSFVRNPWSRAVSSFFWILDKSYDELHPHRATKEMFIEVRKKYGKSKDFNAFIKAGLFRQFLKRQGRGAGPVLRPQWFWVTYDKQDIAVDFLGKFESLQKDFDTVCDKIGVDRIKLPHEHKTKHKHYSEYYDAEAREIVGNMYWRDIDLFNYTFEK